MSHSGQIGPLTPTVGIDVGGTKVFGALVDAGGEILMSFREPTPDNWPGLLETIVKMLDAFRSSVSGVSRVGLGTAGLVGRDGVVYYAPHNKMFRNLAVKEALEKATDVVAIVDNDANVAAYAEAIHGAAKGVPNALCANIGTGIGGGIVINRQIYRGARGFAAEIGHFVIDRNGPMCACGVRGHFEAIASGNALGAMARENALRVVASGEESWLLDAAGDDINKVDGRVVTDAVQAGDARALSLLKEFGARFAIGLEALVRILDPQIVVIGGGLVDAGEPLLHAIRDNLSIRLGDRSTGDIPDVVRAVLGSSGGAIGAAALARTIP